MTLTLWTMDIPDPDELATFAVDPKSGAKSFFTTYNNPTVVKDTHAAEQTTDARRSGSRSTTPSRRGAAHDAFMAFLYYSPYPYATTTNVHGFFVTPLGNMPHGGRLAQQADRDRSDRMTAVPGAGRSPGRAPEEVRLRGPDDVRGPAAAAAHAGRRRRHDHRVLHDPPDPR